MPTTFQAVSESVQKSEAVFEAAIEVTNALHKMRVGYSNEKWEELIDEHSLLQDLVDSTIDLEDAIEDIAREKTNA